MKTKKLRARRMWANYYPSGIVLHPSKESAIKGSEEAAQPEAVPVAVIPLDDPEALVNSAVSAVEWRSLGTRSGRADFVRAALAAIGVLPKQRKGRK